MDEEGVVWDPSLERAVRVLKKPAVPHRGLPEENGVANFIIPLGVEKILASKEGRERVQSRVDGGRCIGRPFNVEGTRSSGSSQVFSPNSLTGGGAGGNGDGGSRKGEEVKAAFARGD